LLDIIIVAAVEGYIGTAQSIGPSSESQKRWGASLTAAARAVHWDRHGGQFVVIGSSKYWQF
jgi:hypothetical protein